MDAREEMEIRRAIPEGGWANLPGVSVRTATRGRPGPRPKSRSVLLPLPPEPRSAAGLEWRQFQRLTNKRGRFTKIARLIAADRIPQLVEFVDDAAWTLDVGPRKIRRKGRAGLLGKTRQAIAAAARARGWSLEEISRELGYKHHASVERAVEVAKSDPIIVEFVEQIAA